VKRDCGCQLQAGRLFLCSLHLTSASSPVAREELQDEITRLREQAEALAEALRNQGLLQNTFHGKVWHIHDCPASFDFAECNYRCRVARASFALAEMEPYVSEETRRDTEVYE